MNRQLKNILYGTGFGVVLFVFLTNYGKVVGSVHGVISMLQPLLIGGVLAFVLNVPMKRIESVLEKKLCKNEMPEFMEHYDKTEEKNGYQYRPRFSPNCCE